VEALRVAPPEHQSARELVDNDDLAIADDVFLIAREELLGAQCVVQIGEHCRVLGVIDALTLRDMDHRLDPRHAFVGEDHDLGALIDLIVLVRAQARRQLREPPIQVGGLLRGPRDDQGRPGLIDEDAVDLVDDGIGQLPLRALVEVDHHVIPQVIETELVVGAIGDVGAVGFAPRDRAQVLIAVVIGSVVGVVDKRSLVRPSGTRLDHAHAHAQSIVDRAHPLDAVLGQVVVGCHEVSALASERVQVKRQRGHQRLALTGTHLGDLTLMQDHAPDELDVIGTKADRTARGLAHRSEGFGQQGVKRFPIRHASTELRRRRAQRLRRESLELRLERIHRLCDLLKAGYRAVVGVTKKLLEETSGHSNLPCRRSSTRDYTTGKGPDNAQDTRRGSWVDQGEDCYHGLAPRRGGNPGDHQPRKGGEVRWICSIITSSRPSIASYGEQA